MKRRITITVFNTFLDTEVAKYIFPYDLYKAMDGWYSDFWRTTRVELASIKKIDKCFIKAKIKYDNVKTDRMQVILPSGGEMDAPFELNKTDIKIIGLHLEATKLAINARN